MAYLLDQAWQNSQLVLVNAAGHSWTEPGMTEAIIAATDQFFNLVLCQT